MAYLLTGPLTDGDAPQTLRGSHFQKKIHHSQCGTAEQFEANY